MMFFFFTVKISSGKKIDPIAKSLENGEDGT